MNIQAKNCHIGKGVVMDPTAIIRGLNGEAESVHIGDYTYIGATAALAYNTGEVDYFIIIK